MAKTRKLKVVYKDLRKFKVWGFATPGGAIEIDRAAKGVKHLEIIIHEALHILAPDLSEDAVKDKAAIITRTLWGEGYRRTDNDTKQKLQDE